MVKCPNCGEESDTKFCPTCGEKLEKNLCPHCNSEIEENAVFCSECGKKIEKEEEKQEDEKETTEEKTSEDKKETTKDKKDKPKKETNKKTTKSKKDKPKKEAKYCPHCNEKLDDDEGIFCQNCGKMLKVDEYSFNGIFQSISTKRLIIVSLLGFAITFALAILLSYIIGLTGSGLYQVAIIVALVIGVGFFASFFKDILNSGLTGIIIGLLIGFLTNTAVDISSGFKYSYEIFSGYEIVVCTVVGLIVAIIANKFLRKVISKHVNVDMF